MTRNLRAFLRGFFILTPVFLISRRRSPCTDAEAFQQDASALRRDRNVVRDLLRSTPGGKK